MYMYMYMNMCMACVFGKVPNIAVRQARRLIRHTGLTFGTVECCVYEKELPTDGISEEMPESLSSPSSVRLTRTSIPRARSNSILMSRVHSKPLYDVLFCNAQALSQMVFPFGDEWDSVLDKIGDFIITELAQDNEDEEIF
eukprot:m.31771 g.31771  ORF g.31771 m.31771 type:complete len:141 (-) comp6331_c0_seq2:50-472(-)